MDIKIFYTFLSVYKKCRRRAYLQYVKKVIPSDQVDHRPFIVGILADILFKKWVERDFSEGWMEGKADEMYLWLEKKKNIRYRNPQDQAGLMQKLRTSVRLLESAAFDANLPDKELILQKKIEKTIEGIKYFGKLDIWLPKEKAIWDLKITKQKRYLDNFQLYFFAWLMREQEEVEKIAFFSPLMKPYLIHVMYSSSLLIDFEQELFTLVETIKKQNWQQTAKDCWGCPVVKWCEEGEVSRSERLPGGGFKIDL